MPSGLPWKTFKKCSRHYHDSVPLGTLKDISWYLYVEEDA